MKYPIIIHKDKGSDYGVTVPDLPGCFSSGTVFEEAVQNAKEAILTHAEGLLLDNEPIPKPSALETYNNKKELNGGELAAVSVNFSKITGRAKKVNVSIPEMLLTKFDAFAMERHETRSGFLVQTALEYINRHG